MGESATTLAPSTTVDRGHEQTDVAVRPLLMFLAGLTLSLIVVAVFVAWMFNYFLADLQRIDQRGGHTQTATEFAPEAPRLQVSPQLDLDRMHRRDEQRLHAVEWVDRAGRIARIPIEEAVSLVLKRGLPQWPKAEVGVPQPNTETPPVQIPTGANKSQSQAAEIDADAGGPPP
jgi:hypothetical protein